MDRPLGNGNEGYRSRRSPGKLSIKSIPQTLNSIHPSTYIGILFALLLETHHKFEIPWSVADIKKFHLRNFLSDPCL